jgi:hypothetical protein
MVESGLGVASEINYMISTNTIVEALGITDADHPKGFKPGITQGLELRTPQEVALDNPPEDSPLRLFSTP